MSSRTVKLILDTDIGSDIDDAVCLAYLLAQPHCELLGITTVTGRPRERAMIASALCRAARRKVPIYPGAAEPLVIEQRQPEVPQAAALDSWTHDRDFPSGEAVEFMRRTIRRNPGEVTLLAIGPMTNLGLLFRVDPEIPGLLRSLVLMCGVFTRCGAGPVEWNAGGDPHAAAIVYAAKTRFHRSIGLDVTTRVRMPADEVRRLFRVPLLRPVLDFAEVWFKRAETLTFHDPLAATTIFENRICCFERGRVAVDLSAPESAGKTAWRKLRSGPHHVALAVDPTRFFRHYFGVLAKAT